ncbi:hypothetical protein [Saliphagus infecundisoli]|uniref:HdeD family acid-resistance protein n=1 Tax=Saliphagus infecundisoli TaxID=1849069 RepID=A0ABD5QKB4_9EURY|nr:hypothetical protein [Saliphagus infecundisoli]
MNEPEPDAEGLQEELGQIKAAMGLAEEYPYWWRFWLIEGIGLGIALPIVQLGLRDGFSPLLVVFLGGVLLTHQLVAWRILNEYDRPTTGVPGWTAWNITYGVGSLALAIGLLPIFEQLVFEDIIVIGVVGVGAISGIAYLYMGQLLAAYNIRTADRYAFYTGGCWLLVLAAMIPHIPFFAGWEFAVFGIGLAVHNIGSYVVLSRV